MVKFWFWRVFFLMLFTYMCLGLYTICTHFTVNFRKVKNDSESRICGAIFLTAFLSSPKIYFIWYFSKNDVQMNRKRKIVHVTGWGENRKLFASCEFLIKIGCRFTMFHFWRRRTEPWVCLKRREQIEKNGILCWTCSVNNAKNGFHCFRLRNSCVIPVIFFSLRSSCCLPMPVAPLKTFACRTEFPYWLLV